MTDEQQQQLGPQEEVTVDMFNALRNAAGRMAFLVMDIRIDTLDFSRGRCQRDGNKRAHRMWLKNGRSVDTEVFVTGGCMVSVSQHPDEDRPDPVF